MQAEVTIIVVHYNLFFAIKKCLEAIAQNTIIPYKLIIVDNDSQNESIEFIKDFVSSRSNVSFLHLNPKIYADFENKNKNILFDNVASGLSSMYNINRTVHGCALNYARQFVDTPYYACLDSDLFVKRGWLEGLLSFADKNIACIGYNRNNSNRSTKIWGGCCLVNTECVRKHPVTLQPIQAEIDSNARHRSKQSSNSLYKVSDIPYYYDTCQYQSTILSRYYKNIALPQIFDGKFIYEEHMENKYYSHVTALTTFSRMLDPEDESFSLYHDDGRYHMHFICHDHFLRCSWWYAKLYEESLPNDIDIKWTFEDHNKVVRQVLDEGFKFIIDKKYWSII